MSAGIVTANFHGSKFSLHDIGGKQCDLIAQGAIYEPALLEWVYSKRLRGMAIDVGANIGNHALWFSEICGLYVYAFEPVEHQLLIDNVNLNRAGSRVRVFKTALGADYGTASEVSKCTLQPGEGEIPVIPLDSVEIPEDKLLSLIKIDVEGMEVDVLQGGMQTIRMYKPIILTEEWEAETTQEIYKLLSPIGYVRDRSFGGRGRAPVGAWIAR